MNEEDIINSVVLFIGTCLGAIGQYLLGGGNWETIPLVISGAVFGGIIYIGVRMTSRSAMVRKVHRQPWSSSSSSSSSIGMIGSVGS